MVEWTFGTCDELLFLGLLWDVYFGLAFGDGGDGHIVTTPEYLIAGAVLCLYASKSS